MRNPLLNTPLNTKQVYVRGVTNTGCEIYMPVDSFTKEDQLNKQSELQNFLNTQELAPLTLV